MKKILLATAVAAAFLLETPLAAQAYHRPSAELTFRPGNKRSILEVDLLGPLYQTLESMLFVDLRGKGDTKRGREANLGLVYRWIVKNAGVAGVYVFGDLLYTRRKNTFWQIVTGLEGLSVGGIWDMRVNAYFVDTKKHLVANTNSATVTGRNINLFKNAEVAMSGFDGEVGVLIPWISTKNSETRLFGGAYSFTRRGLSKVAGPQGRLEVRFYDLFNAGSRLTLGVEVSNDKIRKNTVFGCIGLRIPFQMSGEKTPQGLQRRLADYVIRDVDIITQDSLPVPQGLLTNVNGQPVRIIHVQASAPNGGDGTIGAPFNDLNVGINAAYQIQDIIHIIYGTSYLQLTNSGALLADKVTVAGDGADLNVTSQTGDVYFVFGGDSAKQSKIISPNAPNTTAFDFSANSPEGYSGTIQGVSVTVPSNTNASAVNATYTAPGKTLTLRKSSFISDGTTDVSYGVLFTTSSPDTTLVGENLTFDGFANDFANTSTAISMTVQGEQGGLTGLFKDNTFTNNTEGLVGILSTTTDSGSLTIHDTGSTYIGSLNSIRCTTDPDPLANPTGKLTVNLTNTTITSSIEFALGFGYLNANSIAPIGVDITIDNLNSTLSGPTSTAISVVPGTMPPSINTLIIKNSRISGVSGDGVTNSIQGIFVSLGSASGGGSFIGTFENNTFQGNTIDSDGADIDFVRSNNDGLATVLNVLNNKFVSPFTNVVTETSSSIRIEGFNDTANTMTLNMVGNTMTGSGGGSGLRIDTSSTASTLNSVVANLTGTTISGYTNGILFFNAGDGNGTQNGVYVLNLLSPGNKITGNDIGVLREGLNTTQVTINGLNADAATLNADPALQTQVFGNATANFSG